MQPTSTRSSRSSIIYPIAPLTSAYVQHQPQHTVYAPIAALQPTGRQLQPNYIYSRSPKNVCPIPAQAEGNINVWPLKSKLLKGQQYCPDQFVHPSSSVLVYKPPVNNFYPTQAQSNASFLFATSPVPPNHYPAEPYNYSNVAILPQIYYKSSDLPQPGPIYANQPQPVKSYYMASANASHLHTVNLNPGYEASSLQSHKTVSKVINHQMPLVQNVSVYPQVQMELVIDDNPSAKVSPSGVSGPTLANSVATGSTGKTKSWPSRTAKPPSSDLYEANASDRMADAEGQKVKDTGLQEEKLSEASSTSFDFTIEAEKMVSALCDVKSPSKVELGAEVEKVNDKDDGAWSLYLACEDAADGALRAKSVATQTPEAYAEQDCSELMRKTALWGCAEAETILKSSRYCQDLKYSWLTNLSTATKTAITKSSVSFPVFGGDRILVHDLINALLRISNGWLALDNYLNKQYYPSLDDKYDIDLNHYFQKWESNTHDLLRSIVQTFQKVEKNTSFSETELQQEIVSLSFPGDVSMYTRCDLFDPFTSHTTHQQSITTIGMSPMTQTSYSSNYFSQTPNFQYINCQQSIKESKLRTKWTITENASAIAKQDNRIVGKVRNTNCSNVSFQHSLNTEFSHLKNKVMESTSFTNSKSNDIVSQKTELLFANKNPSAFTDETIQSKSNLKISNSSSSSLIDTLYYQNCVLTDSINANQISNLQSSVQNPEEGYLNYSNSNNNVDHAYLGKTMSNKFELVPKAKVTLLSQIEPNVSENSNQQEMTAHLSAWFASMRNSPNPQTDKYAKMVVHRQQDVVKNAIDLSRQLKMDANKQLLTLKNMQSIQSAPWNALNLLNETKPKTQKGPEECESSEDLRVYMKPGSYNVPKKRHQKKSKNYQAVSKNTNRVSKNQNCRSNSKDTYNLMPTLPNLTVSSTNGSNIGNIQSFPSSSSLNSSSKKDDGSQIEASWKSPDKYSESTWKAACASAEILLKALNVNKPQAECNKFDKELNGKKEDTNSPKVSEFPSQSHIFDMSSREASEDENTSNKDSHNVEGQSLSSNKNMKNSIKTDSWLLQTLKLRNRNPSDEPIMDNIATDGSSAMLQDDSKVQSSNPDQDQSSTFDGCLLTYSDMTRKEHNKVPKEPPMSTHDTFLLTKIGDIKVSDHNQKTILKHNCKNYQILKNDSQMNKWSLRTDRETEKCQMDKLQLKKRRKVKIKDNLLAINSKKKFAISTLVFDKFENIHQQICQMEGSQLLKCPASSESDFSMDDYKKIIKNPMFFETVDYKLRNRIYTKVTHIIDDYFKIFQNSRIYYKDSKHLLIQIQAISDKLEELLEEYFSNH